MLVRENNNFELLRLAAACLVIVGHAYPLTAPQGHDFVTGFLGFEYAGSIAVKFFFLLSGLVVTNSLMERPSLFRFLCARVMRIFPALIVVVVLTALVVGASFTTLPRSTYLASGNVWSFIGQNILLISQYNLPGVFMDNPLRAANGAIWTLPTEFMCYVMLACLGAIGFARHRISMTVAIVSVSAYLFYDSTALQSVGVARNALPQIIFFCTGALMAAWKAELRIDGRSIAACAIGAFALRGTGMFPYLMDLTIFMGAILASTAPLLRTLRLPGDFSFGLYLSGWPIQQMLVAGFPHMSIHAHQTLAIGLATAFGAVSWFAIEHPCIKLGRRIGDFGAAIYGAVERRFA